MVRVIDKATTVGVVRIPARTKLLEAAYRNEAHSAIATATDTENDIFSLFVSDR